MQQKNFLKLFVGLIITACLLSVFSLFITSGNYLLQHDPRAIDFLAFYTGGTLIAQDTSHLYNLHSQQVLQNEFLPMTKKISLFIPFLNPPFTTLLFVPFKNVNIVTAYDIWLFINFLIVVIISYMFYKKLQTRWFYKILIIILVITFIPLLTTLLTGQLSLLLCVIVICSWLLLQKGQLFWSGFLFSLMLIKPHFFVIPFLVHLIQRQKHFLGGLFAGACILLFVSFLLVGLQGITTYISLLLNASFWSIGYRVDLMAQHSIQTVLLLLFQTTNLADIRILWLAINFSLVIAMLYVWRKKYPLHSKKTALQWSLLFLTLLLTSPHSHFHDLTLLLILPFLFLSQWQKINEENKKYVLLFLILYSIELIGYLLTLWTGKFGNHLWILIDVFYQLYVWFILFSQLLKSENQSKK